MKYALRSLLLAGGLALSIGTAKAIRGRSPRHSFRTTAHSRSKMPVATSSDPRIASARTSRHRLPGRACRRALRASRSCCSIPKVVPRPACRTWWFMASRRRKGVRRRRTEPALRQIGRHRPRPESAEARPDPGRAGRRAQGPCEGIGRADHSLQARLARTAYIDGAGLAVRHGRGRETVDQRQNAAPDTSR